MSPQYSLYGQSKGMIFSKLSKDSSIFKIESGSGSVLSDSIRPHGQYSPWDSPGQNPGVGSLSLLQGSFPTQGLNPSLPHCRRILYQLSYQGSPRILGWVACPFSSRSSWPRNQTMISCITGRFFTNWATRGAQGGLNIPPFTVLRILNGRFQKWGQEVENRGMYLPSSCLCRCLSPQPVWMLSL